MSESQNKTYKVLTKEDSEEDASLVDSTLKIFLVLGEGRVYYQALTKNLYFVDSLEITISDMIKKVFLGFNQAPDIQQCFLDKHSFFKGAFRLQLTESQANTVLVALRMRGVRIKIDD